MNKITINDENVIFNLLIEKNDQSNLFIDKIKCDHENNIKTLKFVTRIKTTLENGVKNHIMKYKYDSFYNINFTHNVFDTEKINEIIDIFFKEINNKNIYNKHISVIEIDTIKHTEFVNNIISKDHFDQIFLTKNFTTNNLSFNSNLKKIKQIHYGSKKISNLHLLPPGLDLLKIKFKTFTNLQLKLPKKLKIIQCNQIKINLENVIVNDISIINKLEKNPKKKYNFNLYDLFNYDCVCIYKCKNNFINIENLPNKIKILYLGNEFDQPIDYLPNSIIKLYLGEYFSYSLTNLPNSITTIVLNTIEHDLDFLADLPDSIEYLYFNAIYIGRLNTNDIVKLPSNIKNITYKILRYWTVKNIDIEEKLIKYRKVNNLSFNIHIKYKSTSIEYF